MIRKQEASSVLVRLPHAVKNWVEEEAAKNCSSQNSEIVRCIVARMDELAAKSAEIVRSIPERAERDAAKDRAATAVAAECRR